MPEAINSQHFSDAHSPAEIAVLVELGFEHSVANMYLIPIGMLYGATPDVAGFAGNLSFVTLGNIVGASLCVAIVYWIVYLRSSRPDRS
jgi:formate transporter